MKKASSIFAAIMAASAAAADPVAAITDSSFDGKVLAVTYTLTEDAIVTFDVKTNGVTIGGAAVVAGVLPGSDAWKKVEGAGTHTIEWRPDAWKGSGVDAVVTAWPLDNPPDYMVADISYFAHPGTQRYYPSADFVPGGVVANARYRTTALLMRKIMAKGIKWTMGATDSTRFVALTNNYYMGVFETTQAQWAQVKGSYPAAEAFTNVLVRDMRPVTGVSYNDIRVSTDNNWYSAWEYPQAPHASSFLGIVRTRTGIDFDLPGEAQWEFAARAGHGVGEWSDGEAETAANLGNLGRYAENGGNGTSDLDCGTDHGTAVCGSYKPSDWGLYDVHGNVAELCLDWTASLADISAGLDYRVNVNPDTRKNTILPDKESSYAKVKKGGQWTSAWSSSKPEWRSSEATNTRYRTLGFRVMCPVEVP